MTFYGDYPIPQQWPPYNGVACTPMPTAIVRIQTTEGFVIAADGRVRDEHGMVLTDDAKKIFPVHGQSLAYALYGTMGLGDDPNVIDLTSQIALAVQSLAGKTMADLVQYGDKLSRPIHKLLLNWKNERAAN